MKSSKSNDDVLRYIVLITTGLNHGYVVKWSSMLSCCGEIIAHPGGLYLIYKHSTRVLAPEN